VRASSHSSLLSPLPQALGYFAFVVLGLTYFPRNPFPRARAEVRADPFHAAGARPLADNYAYIALFAGFY